MQIVFIATIILFTSSYVYGNSNQKHQRLCKYYKTQNKLPSLYQISKDSIDLELNKNVTDSLFSTIISHENEDYNLTCRLESGISYAYDETPTDKLKIFEYNIDKNGYWMDSPLEKGHIELQKAILNFYNQEKPDILVFIEVARDCLEYGNINMGEYLGSLLNMNYYYAPENIYFNNEAEYKNQTFLESYIKNLNLSHLNPNNVDKRNLRKRNNKILISDNEKECSVGTLVLTNRKIVNKKINFYEENCCSKSYYFNAKSFIELDIEVSSNSTNKLKHIETDLNQNSNSTYKNENIYINEYNNSNDTLSTCNNKNLDNLDKKIYKKKTFKFINTHLESGGKCLITGLQGFIVRKSQMNYIIEYLKVNENKYDEAFIIGDLNTPFINYDPMFWNAYKENYLKDSFDNYCYFCRNTCPFAKTANYNLGNLDYIFSVKNHAFYDSIILNNSSTYSFFYGLSDHNPIFTKYKI